MDVEAAVLEFMMKHSLLVAAPDEATAIRRLAYVTEEVAELAAALQQADRVAVADACADLVYVAVGTALAFGIPFNRVFAEVHRSNMTKGLLNVAGKGGKNCAEFESPRLETLL